MCKLLKETSQWPSSSTILRLWSSHHYQQRNQQLVRSLRNKHRPKTQHPDHLISSTSTVILRNVASDSSPINAIPRSLYNANAYRLCLTTADRNQWTS